jgi:hypothetical protein
MLTSRCEVLAAAKPAALIMSPAATALGAQGDVASCQMRCICVCTLFPEQGLNIPLDLLLVVRHKATPECIDKLVWDSCMAHKCMVAVWL